MRPKVEAGPRHTTATELQDPEIKKLPKEVRKGISEAFSLAEQVKENPTPRTIEDLEQILPRVNELATEIIDSLRPHKKENETWRDTLGYAWGVASIKSLESGRSHIWRTVFDGMSRRLPYPGSTNPLAGAVETVRDQEGVTNPYMPILKLYALGASRVSFDSINYREYETLTVRFPVSLENSITSLDAVVAAGDTKVRHLVARGQPFYEIPSGSSE